jgi:beta-lactam-binding protein with PASTA domain
MSTIKLDSKGSATCQITVKNVSRTAIDGRAVLVSLPPASKTSPGVVEKNWIKIDGTTDRHFAVDQEEVFSVKIAVPQKKGEAAPAGNYSFRLDVINTARPDDSGDQSQALGFTVAAAAPQSQPKWPWIVAIAALVLIIGGVTTWLLMRKSTPDTSTSDPKPPSGISVPDLTGKTTTDAYTILAQNKLILDQTLNHADSTPANSGKIVAQKPVAGASADPGSIVQVTLGSPVVAMPSLQGHTFSEAQAIANQQGLGAVSAVTAANASFSSKGIVWEQTPAAGANVRTGTAVSLKVTPQDITVALVVGMPFVNAAGTLERQGLSLGQITGDHNRPVIGQSPAPNTQVPVGTRVNLLFPPCVGLSCVQTFNAAVAHQMLLDRTILKR